MRVMEWVRSFLESRKYNIKYEIIGREDGRWVVCAFDRYDRQIGNKVTVNTPAESWVIFQLLNNYPHAMPYDPMDKTDPLIDQKDLSEAV